MNLYNKYRPNNFDDLVGNEFNKNFLKGIVKNRGFEIRREFLFTSPKIGGVGKTTSALILAKAINCLNSVDGNPCNQCKNCKAFDNKTFKDFISLNGADYNQVDKVKPIIDLAKQLPLIGKYRIVVIDEIQRMSSQALSEFLNLFEFGINKTIFIFTTTNKEKIIQPLITRMINLTFRPLSDEEMTSYLKHICEEEGITYSNSSLESIVLEANGSLRDAISTLEKHILAFKSIQKSKPIVVEFAELLARTIVLGVEKTEQLFYKYQDSYVNNTLPKVIMKLKYDKTFLNQLENKYRAVFVEDVLNMISENFIKYKPTNIKELILMFSFLDFSRVLFVDKTAFNNENKPNELEIIKSQLIDCGFVEVKNEI